MENQKEKKNETSSDSKSSRRPGNPNIWLMAFLMMILMILFFSSQRDNSSLIRYDFFIQQVMDDNVLKIELGDSEARGLFKNAPNKPDEYDTATGKLKPSEDRKGKPIRLKTEFRVVLPSSGEERNQLTALLNSKEGIHVSHLRDSENALKTAWLLSIFLPLGLLILFMWFMYRRSRDQIMGGGGFLSGFNKSPAKKYESDKESITFDDVAGLTSVKADLMEVVEFLKAPKKFQRLGGHVPKGVLLLGPPGTGKTLLSRAVAGEANVPFFSVNGSEFIQMFVGVGASRVRDLFKIAKENSPSIVFIDEIDAVGRQRGAGLGGGHDEREQTLNQILSEMDGFSQSTAVIVLAATNRPDVLDPALLRPGRFDRHVTVDRPTRKGRVEIFKVHVRDVPLSEDVDLERLAAGTVGMTGADIRNLVNEAALWATRQDKTKVDMDDFEYARDKILMGPTREDVLIEEEKEKTAYHESGHALLAWLAKGADRVHKVTVIPRGQALGVTQTLPEEDRMNISESELHNRLAFFLGGREAERLIYNESSAGAENDLERATNLARRMVTQWGMSERLGPVSYKLTSEDPFLGREMHEQRQFSESTLQIVDEEVARILHSASEHAHEILMKNRDKLEKMTRALMEHEELDEGQITDLIGPSIQQLEESSTATTAREIAAQDSISNIDV